MQKQFIDLNSAPEPFKYLDLFTKPKPATKPKAADMSYEQGVMALYQHGALSLDYLTQTSARNELTMICKHVSKERGCDFNAALDYVLNTSKPMTDADFAATGKIDPSTKEGRDAIHAAVIKDMGDTGTPFTVQYPQTMARLVKEGKIQ